MSVEKVEIHTYIRVYLSTLLVLWVLTDWFFRQHHCIVCLLLRWNYDERVTNNSRRTFIVSSVRCICRCLDWRLALPVWSHSEHTLNDRRDLVLLLSFLLSSQIGPD